MLLLCALFHKDGKVLRNYSEIPLLPDLAEFDMSISIIEPEEYSEKVQKEVLAEPNKEIIKEISDKLSYKYEYLPLSTVASKMTASSLDDSDNNFEFITSSKPAFMNKAEMTPAERGTAMHTFMQFCNYEKAKDDLETEISRLLSCGFISNEQANALDKAKLNSFFDLLISLPLSFYSHFAKSLITSPAMINPATDGTNATLPGVDLRFAALYSRFS